MMDVTDLYNHMNHHMEEIISYTYERPDQLSWVKCFPKGKTRPRLLNQSAP